MQKVLNQLFIIATLFTNQSFAQNTGDLLLQSNRCYLCGMIEAEEKSSYSHIGIVVAEGRKINVLEAWGKMKKTSLEEFLSRRSKKTQTLILRPKNSNIRYRLTTKKILARFYESFAGKSYDTKFLWNNSDEQGEMFYCSEFAAKFLNPYLIHPILTKPMHYEVNREYWIKYFQGNPPDELPGISPGDFERSPLFQHMGYL